MITKEQIIDIARDELTPIGWHEEHAKYIDGLDAFAERLVKLCNISHVSNSVCPKCGNTGGVHGTILQLTIP